MPLKSRRCPDAEAAGDPILSQSKESASLRTISTSCSRRKSIAEGVNFALGHSSTTRSEPNLSCRTCAVTTESSMRIMFVISLCLASYLRAVHYFLTV